MNKEIKYVRQINVTGRGVTHLPSGPEEHYLDPEYWLLKIMTNKMEGVYDKDEFTSFDKDVRRMYFIAITETLFNHESLGQPESPVAFYTST